MSCWYIREDGLLYEGTIWFTSLCEKSICRISVVGRILPVDFFYLIALNNVDLKAPDTPRRHGSIGVANYSRKC